ncbi:unnamed protein product [Vitrella brassicaformis CCMP3155]|uniref:Uncharacterized protein n=1 Tax=Vitrella brassicaformis (strain CCMP3155) TaxID=1169540 RepID=A0A0G4EQ43_VITBC|nr:unnamed protein product [Vitrella brassicaformis CCMP3155]|eukprot:CEL99549.1 unnamed protein product [Vitrella brassicaformis CCMP3155]
MRSYKFSDLLTDGNTYRWKQGTGPPEETFTAEEMQKIVVCKAIFARCHSTGHVRAVGEQQGWPSDPTQKVPFQPNKLTHALLNADRFIDLHELTPHSFISQINQWDSQGSLQKNEVVDCNTGRRVFHPSDTSQYPIDFKTAGGQCVTAWGQFDAVCLFPLFHHYRLYPWRKSQGERDRQMNCEATFMRDRGLVGGLYVSFRRGLAMQEQSALPSWADQQFFAMAQVNPDGTSAAAPPAAAEGAKEDGPFVRQWKRRAQKFALCWLLLNLCEDMQSYMPMMEQLFTDVFHRISRTTGLANNVEDWPSHTDELTQGISSATMTKCFHDAVTRHSDTTGLWEEFRSRKPQGGGHEPGFYWWAKDKGEGEGVMPPETYQFEPASTPEWT